MDIILNHRVPIDNLLLSDARTYDTFTELIKIVGMAESTIWGNFDNVAIIASIKQTARVVVMLQTLLSADDPIERARFDHYFEVYMPRRLTIIPEARVQEAFDYFKTIAYRDILPNTATLRRKKIMIVSSENITGTNLAEDEKDLNSNYRGVQDWLNLNYGHEYMQPDKSTDGEIEIVIRRSSDPTETPRIHIPFIGAPEAKEAGIRWGLTTDIL